MHEGHYRPDVVWYTAVISCVQTPEMRNSYAQAFA